MDRINTLANERQQLWFGRGAEITNAYPRPIGPNVKLSSHIETLGVELANLYLLKRLVLSNAGIDFLW